MRADTGLISAGVGARPYLGSTSVHPVTSVAPSGAMASAPSAVTKKFVSRICEVARSMTSLASSSRPRSALAFRAWSLAHWAWSSVLGDGPAAVGRAGEREISRPCPPSTAPRLLTFG